MIAILTGPVQSGKTTFLENAVRELRHRNVRINGYLSEVIREQNTVLGYDLNNLREKTVIPYIRKQGLDEWERAGAYFFLPQGLEEAKKIILSHRPPTWLIVDEIGPLELSGKGVWPAFLQVLSDPLTRILCVVRRSILDDFLGLAGQKDSVIFDIQDKSLFSNIIRLLTSTKFP